MNPLSHQVFFIYDLDLFAHTFSYHPRCTCEVPLFYARLVVVICSLLTCERSWWGFFVFVCLSSFCSRLGVGLFSRASLCVVVVFWCLIYNSTYQKLTILLQKKHMYLRISTNWELRSVGAHIWVIL